MSKSKKKPKAEVIVCPINSDLPPDVWIQANGWEFVCTSRPLRLCDAMRRANRIALALGCGVRVKE